MIMRSDFTPEELKRDTDPLSYICHPVSKLNFISTLIHATNDKADLPAFEVFNSNDMCAMGEIIEDCTLEIKYLVDIAEDQDVERIHAFRAVEKLIQNEDQKADALRETNPAKADEKLCYILGLTKALVMIKAL